MPCGLRVLYLSETGIRSRKSRLFKRYLDWFTEFLNFLGAALIVLVMLLVNADVLSRSLFDKPVPGVPELVSISIVAIVFLQIAHAFRKGRFTRATAIPDFIGKYSMRLRASLELLLCMGAGFIMLQLLLASWPLFIKAWSRNSYKGAIGNFTVPDWPVKLIILIGCVTLIAQILALALRSARSILLGTQTPTDSATAEGQGNEQP